MVSLRLLVVAVCGISGIVCVHSQATCTAGDTSQTSGQFSSSNTFAVNMNSNDCGGTVIAWHYCFYTDGVSSGDTYEFDAGIYRVLGNNDLRLVSGSQRNIRLTGSSIMDAAAGRSFVCDNLTLSAAEQFEVLEEDVNVVGACVRDIGNSNSRKALRIISESVTGTDLTTASESVCDSTSVNDDELGNQLSDAALHLYAEIMPPATVPSVSDVPAEPSASTSASTTSAQPEPTSSSTDAQQPSASSSSTEGVGVEPTSSSDNNIVPTMTPSAMTTTPPPSSVGSSNRTTLIAVVVVVVSAVIILAMATVVAIVLFRHFKKGSNERVEYSVQRKQVATLTTGIDNAVYSAGCDLDGNYQTIAEVGGRIQVYNGPTYEVPMSQLGSVPKSQLTVSGRSTLSSMDTIAIYEYAEFGPDIAMNHQKDIYANLSPYCIPATVEDELYEQLKAFGIRSIYRKDIEVVSHLGSGQFGSVDQGVWRRPNDSAVDVALKTLNEGASEQEKVRFLQEGAIMAQFRHPNVVSLHGVVSREPLLLVTELVRKGNLQQFLISAQSDFGDISVSNFSPLLLSFSQQVALGMQYLTGKKFVHRDLAARNILVSSDNVCKVADFGMSRDLADEQYYVSHGGKIPVKWTAPEALHFKKYSTASDVWSYGCLLYEIWSVGHKPFEGKKHNKVIQLVDNGFRLPPPPGCPRRVYELMIAAWHPESSKRPGFRDLLLALMLNEEEVLCVPGGHEEGSQAGVLGAPLKEGEGLYLDLQKQYC